MNAISSTVVRVSLLALVGAGSAARVAERTALILVDQGVVRGIALNHAVASYQPDLQAFDPRGTPFDSFVPFRPGIPTYITGDRKLAVRAVNGVVSEVVSIGPTGFTERLVKPGIPATAVVRAYGNPPDVVKTGCGVRFSYPMKGLNARFWICPASAGNLDAVLSSPVAAISLATSDMEAADAVMTTLQSYAAAYSSMDVEGVCRVQPRCSRSELRSQFAAMKAYSLTFDVQQLTVKGNMATVVATENASYQPKVGRSGRYPPSTKNVELSRASGAWTISGLR